MIWFYRTEDCKGCEQIEEMLRELSVRHEVIVVEGDRDERLPAGTEAPVLVDGDEVIEGMDAIAEHIPVLEKFMALWYKYQSDVCYCDDEE